MHALWSLLTCFAAMFAFGFLLAGILGCADLDRLETPGTRQDWLVRLVDAVILGSLGFLVSGLVKNWAKQREERRMVYVGLTFLALVAVFGCLAVYTR